MKNITFHFEIKDLITQFVAAFDDIIIKRYNKDREANNLLQVRYVYSPKERVMYDIVNKAQNITIPCVAVNITSVSRDESRVFNKIGGYYFSQGTSDSSTRSKSTFVRSPIPVNISINMSILTKFQSDMDQIISNFVPYNNPYIILSWKLPLDLAPEGFSIPHEIRSEVLWDGNISLSYPTDISANEKFRIVGDTSFVIKGWLFQSTSNSKGNIYYINNNFKAENRIANTSYSSLTSRVVESEYVGVSGFPGLTNVNFTYNI